MIIINNKKAFFNYEIKETYEAGIILKGWEVKSIRLGKAQIKESYIKIYKNEIFIFNSYIDFLNKNEYENIENKKRTRKLLLTSNQIKKLTVKVNIKGYTLIPLDLHYKNNLIKSKIGLVKGKKQYHKKESKKNKNIEKEIQISFKNIVLNKF